MVTVVGILKNEESFVEEWVAYHRCLGVAHFIIYDNSEQQSLANIFHGWDFVSIVRWGDSDYLRRGRNKQTDAYTDALARVNTPWVAFLDGDEFIRLNRHPSIPDILSDFSDCDSIAFPWHVYGHSGHYSDAAGLITAELTRRRRAPGAQFKSISRLDAISEIVSPHSCVLRPGRRAVDPNRIEFTGSVYDGIDSVAAISHYMCRSFVNWMSKVDRGDVAFTPTTAPEKSAWRFDSEACLRKFVRMCRDWNELNDPYMTRYASGIQRLIDSHRGLTTHLRGNSFNKD